MNDFLYVVIYGTAVDGFAFFGPYSKEEAEKTVERFNTAAVPLHGGATACMSILESPERVDNYI